MFSTAYRTADMEFPTRFILTEDVEVFGLYRPLSWPKGTEVTYLGGEPAGPFLVVGPQGRGVKLPVRLLGKVSG